MKSLTQYVKESYDKNTNTVALRDLVIKYGGPSELSVVVPTSFSDDDVWIYLEDTMLSRLPGGKDAESTSLFGTNDKNIVDTHFEIEEIVYDENTVTSGSQNMIEWDKSYNPKKNAEDMKTAKIKDISYIIEFSKFVMKGVTDDTFKDKLDEIINNTISEQYDYPMKLSVNTADITYKQ